MITSAEEYFANMFKIAETNNIPTLATLLPHDEPIYDIDLNSRTVEAPEFLSVLDDHASETIYFRVDRFFNNMDMSTTACVIQYINAAKEGRLYVVPYYDIETFHDVDKMLIPWCIEGEATKAAGDVIYSIRFFNVDESGKYLIYNLNTIPTTSKVLNGLNILGYNRIDLTETQFNENKNSTNPVIYYIRTADGGYTKAPIVYQENQTYYTLTEGYDYSADTLSAILAAAIRVNDGFKLYWTDITHN